MVKITIIGTGYVGLVSGVCFADLGHDVICCDISEEKINMLKNNQMPIFEEGLEELVIKNVLNNKLKFTTDIQNAIKESVVIFSCVGTPMGEDHRADLKYVKEVAKIFASNLNSYKVFVNKSTVPVGTGYMTKKIIKANTNEQFDIISNPEFLKEGSAINDFLNPDRIVIGFDSPKAKEIMRQIYAPLVEKAIKIIYTDIKSSELIKYAANSMLATRISFINEIANFCDKVGANVKEVAKGIGLDSRIGNKFLEAGVGYGGSCFPKDVVALIESGKDYGINFDILNAVERVNFRQKTIIIDKLLEKISDLKNKTITIWGLAFKAGTDDIREAPSIYIIEKLLQLGAKVNVYDKIAQENFQKFHKDFDINYFDDKYESTKNSYALLVLTNWEEFKTLDFNKLKENLSYNIICDGRNMYNSNEIIKQGFEYIGIGQNINFATPIPKKELKKIEVTN